MKCILILLLLGLPAIAYCQRVNLVTLSDLYRRLDRGGDTTYIINFWATWCGPCVEELPAFEALNKQTSRQKLKVLLICVDFKTVLKTAVVPFVKRKDLRSEIFLLNEKSQQEYIDRVDKNWSGAIPATLFIKQNKRQFFEQAFTYPSLLKTYKNFQL